MTGPSFPPCLGLDEVYLLTTRDGSDTLFSRKFNSTYHSINGAVAESRHVFLQHGLLTQAFRNEIHILEFGFGTGLNAFLAYLFSVKEDKDISYDGIESFPICLEVARRLSYPEYLAAPDAREVFMDMHSSREFHNNHFNFHLHLNTAEFQPTHPFDCVFFDAFDPSAQPEVWTADLFHDLYHLTSVGGCLVTYCAQGEVRRNMQKAGYEVERLSGAPGKREMLRAIRLT